MTYDPQSKLPLPVEVRGIDFRSNKGIVSHVVLELQTDTNPVRFFLTKQQLQELASKAQNAATKLT